MALIEIAGKFEAIRTVPIARHHVGIREPAGQAVGAAALQADLGSASVSPKKIAVWNALGNRAGSDKMRFPKTEYVVTILAVVYLGQNPRPAPESVLDTEVEVGGPFGP